MPNGTFLIAPRARPLLALASLVASSLLWARAAGAEPRAHAPAGGGLPALDVQVDLAHSVLKTSEATIPIPLDRARLPDAGEVVVEVIPVGLGRYIAHVRVPVRSPGGGPLPGAATGETHPSTSAAHPADDGNHPDAGAGGATSSPAWEALLAAGHAEPIFSGMTGLNEGDPGERSGKAIQVVPNGNTSFVLVGEIHEDLTICGQKTTLLAPLALYPASLELRPATVQRLSVEQREDAETIVATDKGGTKLDAPLGKLLTARGSSVPASHGQELIDGDVRTTWRELRPGIGQGEFVVMTGPTSVPVSRMQIVVAPPASSSASGGNAGAAASTVAGSGTGAGAGTGASAGPGGTSAVPKTFYLVTASRTFEVKLPEGAARKPGEVFEIKFPEHTDVSCVALVLGDAYAVGQAHPDVGIAELVAYSELDGPGETLDTLAARLSSASDRDRNIAKEILERAGPAALTAVTQAYDRLDERGRSLAVDVAAAAGAHCEDAAPLFARALCEPRGHAARIARGDLVRCGEAAAPVLAKKLSEDPSSTACVAPMLARLAPKASLEVIGDAMARASEADHPTRNALRAAFSEALKSAPPSSWVAMVRDERRNAAAKLEILRAAQDHVAEAPAEANRAIADIDNGSSAMRIRYLVLDPLAALAQAGDAAAIARLNSAISSDPDWPVRAHAAELARGPVSAQSALAAASKDGEPRVREAALASLALRPSGGGVSAAIAALGRDEWSFVKTQAASVLAAAPPSHDADEALGDALKATAPTVRKAALGALARHRARDWHKAIRDRLDDADEEAEVRAAAASALGAVCDGSAADRLTELARALSGPAESEQQQVAVGALVGLAILHPPDLRKRINPLLAPTVPPYVRALAQKALAEPGRCGVSSSSNR